MPASSLINSQRKHVQHLSYTPPSTVGNASSRSGAQVSFLHTLQTRLQRRGILFLLCATIGGPISPSFPRGANPSLPRHAPPAAPRNLRPPLAWLNVFESCNLPSSNGASSSRAALHSFRKLSKPYQADDDMPHLDSASQDKLASLQQARRACLVPSKPQPRPPASRGAPPVRRVLRHGAP